MTRNETDRQFALRSAPVPLRQIAPPPARPRKRRDKVKQILLTALGLGIFAGIGVMLAWRG